MSLIDFDRRLEPLNFPPSRAKDESVCPFYSQIELAALFAGVDEKQLESDFFCGVSTKPLYSRGALGIGRSQEVGIDRIAKATCRDIFDKLKKRIELAKNPVQAPSEEETLARVNSTTGLDQIANTIAKDNALRKKQQERQDVLDEWRQTVFDLNVAHAGEDAGPHFKPVERPEDLTDEDVLGTVGAFFGTLSEVVIGNEGVEEDNSFLSVIRPAKNCGQSPISGMDIHTHID